MAREVAMSAILDQTVKMTILGHEQFTICAAQTGF
jgi:hypothetical protein